MYLTSSPPTGRKKKRESGRFSSRRNLRGGRGEKSAPNPIPSERGRRDGTSLYCKNKARKEEKKTYELLTPSVQGKGGGESSLINARERNKARGKKGRPPLTSLPKEERGERKKDAKILL